MSNILVTSAAGYLSSNATLFLEQSRHDVLILDQLVYGHRELV